MDYWSANFYKVNNERAAAIREYKMYDHEHLLS